MKDASPADLVAGQSAGTGHIASVPWVTASEQIDGFMASRCYGVAVESVSCIFCSLDDSFPHLFFFSSENILELLSRSGFELLHVYRYSLMADLLRWKLSSKLGRSRTSHHGEDRNREAVARMSGIKARIAFISPYRIGALFPLPGYHQTMIVLARKR